MALKKISVFLLFIGGMVVLLTLDALLDTTFLRSNFLRFLHPDNQDPPTSRHLTQQRRAAGHSYSNNNTKSIYRDIFNPSHAPRFPIGPDNVTDKDKYFIYRCDEHTMRPCGGLSDRIKGAMYAYMIANLTGRHFKMEIVFDSCDTYHFIVPNQVDWYLPTPFHRQVRPGGNVAVLDKVDDNDFITSLNHDFSSLPAMKAKYVYFKVNKEPIRQIHKLYNYQEQLAWMRNASYADTFNAIYRRLFKPSPYMQTKLQNLWRQNLQPETTLVCAHLRMGQNPTLSLDTGHFIDEDGLPAIWDFLYNVTLQKDIKIFLMSDSAKVISQAQHLTFHDKFFFTPGSILHIDRSPGTPAQAKCEGYEKIILEEFILMHCDVLILTPVSGISRTASYIRGSDDSMYCVSRSGRVYPCSRHDFWHRSN